MNPDIEVIAYEPEHAVEILARPHDVKNVKANPDFEAWAKVNALGPAWTGRRISDGKILACAGVRILWPGCGEAWAIFCDPEVVEYKYKKEAYVYILTYLKRVIEDYDLRRVQALVRADIPIAVKYIEQLGFEREGLLRKYGREGEDQYMYALILEG